MNKPAKRFLDSIDQLDKVFREGINSTSERFKEIALSAVTVKLHDQWNFRSRQIILMHYGKSEGRMMKILRQNWARTPMQNRWEPDWHIPSNSIRAARLLSIPDIDMINDAFGAVTYVEDIRWARNAIVHNIPISFVKYRQMAVDKYRKTRVMPYQLIAEINPSTGNTIYQDWCEQLHAALNSAL